VKGTGLVRARDARGHLAGDGFHCHAPSAVTHGATEAK
jgi:hypothetical protein